MSHDFRFEGRLALVTGAGTRLGREIALALGRAGADVAAHFHTNASGAAEVVAILEGAGRRARSFRADLTCEDGAKNLFDMVAKELGVPSLLVNNAGVLERSPFTEISPQAWDRLMAINLRAPALLIREMTTRLRAQKSSGAVAGPGIASRTDAASRAGAVSEPGAASRAGAVVNIADIAGIVPWSNHAHYAASKAALLMLTRCLARELADDGIRVNAVAPGIVLPAAGEEEAIQRALARVPMGRIGTPGNVADAVLFLLSDAADYITGQILPVDGGRTVG